MMEYRMSSYRAIMASTAAILNSEATSIPEESHQDDTDPGLGEAADEGVVRDIADNRFQLVFDLYFTERQYLLHLESVLDTYAEPFRKFTALSKEDHQILFVGLEPIVSIGAMLLSKLDDAVQSWDPTTTKIGNLFSSKYWKYYDDYANNYSAITRTLEDKYENDESFVEFLNLRQGSSPFSLEDLLTLPVQRIPQYDKYLNELLQETDQSHPDFEDLKRAADRVRNMVKEREDELYNMDNQKRMERVQDKFPHDDLQLRDLDAQRRQLATRRKSAPGAVLFKTLGKSKSTNNVLTHSMGKKELEFFRPSRQHNFNRQYLMEGLVEFSRGMQTQDRYLFLFSDLLLVAKQKSTTTFKLKHRIRVCELWISFCIDDVTEVTRPTDRSFVIGWPTTNVVATFKSFDLKETWLNKLTEQIQEERGKQMPKSIKLNIMNKEVDRSCDLEVDNETDARTILQSCLQLLQISDSEIKDYQLWVKLGNDESPYPLIGHELPYSIKMSHIREYAKRSEDNLNELEVQQILTEMNNNNNRKYEFVLKHNKKSPKKHSIEEHSGGKKGKRKSPLISLFRKNREDKKPVGKLFGHQLTNITTPEELIARPVKELLTILFREGPYTVGILRKSPNAKMTKELRQKIDDGEDCLSNETWPPLVIGALLKDFLRNIPQSLLMEEYYEDWVAANDIPDGEEKINKLRDTISKLPPCHYELLRHLMCVLHYVDKRSEENKMTAYNLSVCIAPSLLWPKGNPDPLATPPAVVQYMIENCGQVFGEESLLLFGEVVEQKLRQDSSTDSDSMHSVLSTHSNFRRDDSSIDSLEREFCTQDSSPRLMKSHHLSPSNLSGDSGLTMSDSQLYDDDGNGNEISDRRHYTRSASHCIDRDVDRPESEASRSLDNQYFYRYDENNPVPPPRRNRRREMSPNLEHYRKQMRPASHSSYGVSGKHDKRQNQNSEFYRVYPRKMSSESLKSVEEAAEAADSERNIKDWHSRPDIGTLIKSASGAHLYYEDFSSLRLYEFDTQNEMANNRRALYKQKSCPVSPQSKYSLSSSRDSVLSDSSGSFLERQYFPDPMSSSVETPESEDRTMSEWLSQQSKQVAYATKRQRRLHSHDDSELGLSSDNSHKISDKDIGDRQIMRNVEHLVSPRASPKIKRRAPLPLSVRRSFPTEQTISPKGSGSNTSKEAEDIIKSPKLTITYCSQDSLDKREAMSEKDKNPSPHLDIYNNNSHLALKQLNLYSSGLQGTSPPPRVVLQGLSQSTEKRDNAPVKASYDSAILSQVHRNSIETGRRNSLDMGDLRAHRYPMEENSVSSEDEQSESDSDEEIEYSRYTTIVNMSPFKNSIPQKLITTERKSNSSESLSKMSKKSSSSESLSKASRQSSSQESLSRNSTTSEDSSSNRPENPPSYQEALHRKFLLDNGMPLDELDQDTLRQREASQRAKDLYEKSMRQYQEQKERYPPLPSQQFEQKLDVVGEHHESIVESDSQTSSDDDDIEWEEKDPKRLYEESLKRYMAEQTRSPLVKSASKDGDFSNSKGGQSVNRNQLIVSSLHRSHSDVGDVNKRLRSPLRDNSNSPTITNSSHSSSRESTPTRRPDHPPPYDSPPPYRHDHNTHSPKNNSERHHFPKAEKLFYQSPQVKDRTTQVSHTGQELPNKTPISSRDSAQNQSHQEVSEVGKTANKHIEQRVYKTAQASGSLPRSSNIDNTVHSAQVDISKYKSPVRNFRTSDVTNIRSKDSVVIIRSSNSSHDSLRGHQTRKQADSNVHSDHSKISLNQTESSPNVFRPRASSLEPKQSGAIQAVQSRTLHSQPARPSSQGPSIVSRSAVDSVSQKSFDSSKTDSGHHKTSVDTAVNRTALHASLGGRSAAGKELPWSVKNIRTMFDKNKQLTSSDSDSSTPLSVPQSSDSTPSTSPNPNVPPTYTPPPSFQRQSNTSPSSTSSSGSVDRSSRGYKGVGSNRNTYTGRYGPQTRGDSFSSSDSSDCSCRYALKCRRDDSSLEEINDLSFTDISFV